MVGLTGFEPATPTTPRWCATKLRYSPTQLLNFQSLWAQLGIYIFCFAQCAKRALQPDTIIKFSITLGAAWNIYFCFAQCAKRALQPDTFKCTQKASIKRLF